MRNFNAGRAVGAGLIGTAAMTMLMLAAPMMGMPKMAIGEMLGTMLHIGTAAGWAMHGVIGVTLAIVYAGLFAATLPGRAAFRGATYGFGVFLLQQIAVTPMMGSGLFSGGNIPLLVGSLMGHLVYGALLGAVYARTGTTSAARLGAITT